MKLPIYNHLIASLKMFFYNIFCKCYIKSFGEKDKRNLKYRVSLCLIFKDEAPFLKEWLDYHLAIGIDHFYLYDNNSTDNYKEIIQSYLDKGIITLYDWSYEQAQAKCYQHCLEKHREESNWIGYIDADEFVCPRIETDIKNWIKKFDKFPSVMIYWLQFGSSGIIKHDYSKNVIEQYTSCMDHFWNYGKCFVNTRFQQVNWNTQFFHHNSYTTYNFFGINIVLPSINQYGRFCLMNHSRITNMKKFQKRDIQINHYYIKSWDIYKSKMTKSDVFFKQNPKDESKFYGRDMQCIEKDYTISRFLIKIKLLQWNNGKF